MIYPLIDNHVDNMRKLETALRNLDLYNLPYITAPFMNKTCIVYSPVSRKHYRAKILSEIFGSGVNVLYIDECTTGTVRLKFIRQIPSVLMLYKTKLLEVSLHNFQFKKEYYEEIQIDLNRLLKDKTMYVLIRSFNDDGIPIVDLCKRSSKVLVLMYQEIIDNFTPTSTIEDLNSDAKSVDEMICFKKKSSISLQSYDEEFICTFAYFVGPYNLAVYQLIDIVNFETEGIEDSLIELKKSGNLKNVTNPEFDTVYYACTPDNTYYLCKIVKFYGNISRMEIQLLKCNKHMFVHLDDLYLVPDMNLGPIEVTLNFRFNAKFDALIERELNKVLINKRINVVIRECEPDSLLVVDIYEIGSSKLIYQDLIDMIIEMEKKEIESIQNITQNGDNLEDNSFGQDLNPKEVNLMKFDDFSVDQSFEKQKIKR